MIKVGSARIDERGNAVGGNAGDQTRREVAIEPYYVHNLGWNIIRAKSNKVAKKIAQAMREACNNDNIGYDQSQRYGVITGLRAYGRLCRIKIKTEADCSSLVRACCIQAGVNVGDFNTANEMNVLLKTGKFMVAKEPLQEGDILVTKSKGHTVVVTNVKGKKPIKEIVKEVLQGKWGNGEERRQKLSQFGYDYSKIQSIINNKTITK